MASGVLSVLYARMMIGIKLMIILSNRIYQTADRFWCFSESANSNNPYFATEQGLCFKRLFMDLV
jgi:hypothetical protein